MVDRLDEGWEELLDPLLSMRFERNSAQRFLETLAAIPTPEDVIERELVRRLWTIPLLLDRIGSAFQRHDEGRYREAFVPWEQSVFVELARILGEPYERSRR